MTGYTYRELGQHGRLGNQLWQIASTYCIALNDRSSCHFPSWEYAPWFNVPDSLFDNDLDDSHNLYPDYLQDLGHILDQRTLISSWFAPSDRAYDAIDRLYPGVDCSEFVAIHVRRGDYLGLPNHHPVCPIEYYEEALDIAENPQTMVFSDDIEWCKTQSLFADSLFATGSEVEDLHTMTLCDGVVMANSTFSWWGAYLNWRASELVVYPKRWYGPEVEADYELMIGDLPWDGVDFPPEWGIG